jgi:hypothetical protein
MSSNEPLWKVMNDAYNYAEWETRDENGYAAEIRAIADWLVPEEDEPPTTPPAPHDIPMRDILWIAYNTRQTTRRRLLAEADCAEQHND